MNILHRGIGWIRCFLGVHSFKPDSVINGVPFTYKCSCCGRNEWWFQQIK